MYIKTQLNSTALVSLDRSCPHDPDHPADVLDLQDAAAMSLLEDMGFDMQASSVNSFGVSRSALEMSYMML